MQMLKLATMVTDTISGVEGMLTHAFVDMGGYVQYLFQPKSLDPETNEPVDKIVVTDPRIKGGIFEEVDVPMELFGQKVEDEGTGFKGKIVQLVYHLGKCLHAQVKPEGLNKKGATYQAHEFDIRRLKGIKKKTLKKLENEEKVPSPTGYGNYGL